MKEVRNERNELTSSAMLEVGAEIKYRMTWPRGEPKFEDRSGIIEGFDTFCASPNSMDSHKYHFRNGKYLVRCISCDGFRIDSVHPDEILSSNK
jgi:hypothetical protein